MADAPWSGDACSLVDAFRAGERSPAEELEASLAAIEAEAQHFTLAAGIPCTCALQTELPGEYHEHLLRLVSEGLTNIARHAQASQVWVQARVENTMITLRPGTLAASRKDVNAPLGGLPMAVKELDPVAGWPLTEASLAFADRVSGHDATVIDRLRAAGAVLAGQTTASEFGGLNVSVTLLHGITGNPWDPTKTTGGSSAGSAAAVAGGLLTLATGGDGGGSIRIPAGFCGLVGMKGTAGRIPRGPRTAIAPLTVVFGCLARSVRDVARYYDVASGYDSRDPYSLPRVEGWERDLGSHDLRGMKVAIAPTLGSAVVRPEVESLVVEAAEDLARAAGLQVVDVPVKLPGLGVEWAMANMASLLVELGDRYPDCLPELTQEMAFGLKLASEVYNLDMAARVERNRTAANEMMADVFEQELAQIRPGQAATITIQAYPGRTFSGRVAFIYPTVTAQTRTAKVRFLVVPSSSPVPPSWKTVDLVPGTRWRIDERTGRL